MARTRKLMPCMKPVISPKISLGSPDIMSMPTVANTNPKHIENKVFGISSPPKPIKVAKAKSINAKISGSPKSRATWARGGAKAVNKRLATVPPTKDATAAVTNARSARPLRAIGLPSNVVATAVDAPGMPSVMEEIAPPYIAP